MHYVGPRRDPVCKFFIVMDLFPFHLRYLQVTMRISKKHNTDAWKQQWASERYSCVFCTRNEICGGENLASRDTNEELEEPQEIQCYKIEAAIKPKINTNVENCLLVFLFVFISCFVPRDHWQIITFVICWTDFVCYVKPPTPCS